MKYEVEFIDKQTKTTLTDVEHIMVNDGVYYFVNANHQTVAIYPEKRVEAVELIADSAEPTEDKNKPFFFDAKAINLEGAEITENAIKNLKRHRCPENCDCTGACR